MKALDIVAAVLFALGAILIAAVMTSDYFCNLLGS